MEKKDDILGSDGTNAMEVPPAVAEFAVQELASLTAAVDAAMVEMQNISPPLGRGECARLIRAAFARLNSSPVGSAPSHGEQLKDCIKGLLLSHIKLDRNGHVQLGGIAMSNIQRACDLSGVAIDWSQIETITAPTAGSQKEQGE